MKVEPKELEKLYEEMTTEVIAECEFTTELVGGQPANDKQLEAFVRFHLGITDEDEVLEAVARIKNEEIGEQDRQEGELDELEEKKSYGLNVIRSDEKGHWLGNWQIKACLKCACTRLEIFTKKKGSKGDLSHLGRVAACGESRKTDVRDRVHLYGDNGKAMEVYYKEFMGSVQSTQGRKSIKHHSSCAPVGTKFSFSLRMPPKKFALIDIKRIFAVIGEIGLGSVKALERGKFKVLSLEIKNHRGK